MLVCDLCLLNLVILVVRGLSGVPGTLGQILLSYLVHMHSRLRSLRQGQVHVGPITWKVLPQCRTTLLLRRRRMDLPARAVIAAGDRYAQVGSDSLLDELLSFDGSSMTTNGDLAS
jgi:hypothetical protein